MIVVEIYRITDTPMLMALPLFSFSGYLLAETQAPERLLHLSRALLGWVPASLPAPSLRMDRFIHAIGALVCVLIAYYSALLVQLEYGDGLYAFASVPVWLCEAIMPLAFAIMALRFLVSAIVGSDESPDRACL